MSVRVLVVKTTSMGDVVHTLPAVEDLLRVHPDARIDWLVETPFAAIPLLHPGVNRVICQAWRQWRKALGQRATWQALKEARRQVRATPYDLVIDFQGLVKSACWALQARGHRVGFGIGSSREALASVCYHQQVTVPRAMQAVERYRRLMAAALGRSFDASLPARFGLAVPSECAWQPPARPYAVLMPCASRVEKLWPLPHWLAVARQLREAGLSLVVLWGNPAEEQLARQLASPSGAEVPPLLDVRACASIIAEACLAVGLDTGFTHLAAAYGLPTVGLYCDHDPHLAGLTGSDPARVYSLGGKGRPPDVNDVQVAVALALAQSSSTQRGG
ncbi:heptosyltransferase-1 [Roseateles sp. YR242]|uniref:lipopolysaccharide heptosyltransferase I n=1 Tax=Roseateles sp. YR242 TaxID=1855305 RepID=UPI0008D0F881|nr:lipopolysaccharide heptosyltransferase I [Roseateles sp. YR242]SEL42633.1 heptosyltransferase-1 [Roseateles sp. YR242]